MKHDLLAIGSKTILLLFALMLVACSSPVARAQTISASNNPALASATTTTSYTIVDTGQTHYYNNTGQINCPQTGGAFFEQDAQYAGSAPSYKDNGDGTITGVNTGLMWQKTPGSKVTFANAVAGAKLLNLGGYMDWRLPTIKELYSLILFSGTDVSPCISGETCNNATPFLDTNYFDFKYGDTNAGERVIDAQYWSSTAYVSRMMSGNATVFGVNFADGRIKGYPRTSPRGEMLEFVRYVRGNPNFGVNSYVNDGNGTITDNATGLMWSQTDSGKGMNWEAALAWVQQKNAEKYLGHSDWRLPNAKELQSIVDYARAPATTESAAIDPMFTTTTIKDEGGKTNCPFFWTSTTHADSRNGGSFAVYLCFGECLGYMQSPTGGTTLMDAHGAGAQRSDRKTGSVSNYPQGSGPQGDVVRINNYVRLVRGANVTLTTNTAGVTATPSAPIGQPPRQGQPPAQGQGQRPVLGQSTQSGQPPQPGQGQPPQGLAGDRTGGRVRAVNGSTISVENPQGKVTIVTNASTKFTANGQASNLASVTARKFVEAIGQKQADGSWLATQVSISDRPPMPPGQQPAGGTPPSRK
jgi:hypothetical protein